MFLREVALQKRCIGVDWRLQTILYSRYNGPTPFAVILKGYLHSPRRRRITPIAPTETDDLPTGQGFVHIFANAANAALQGRDPFLGLDAERIDMRTTCSNCGLLRLIFRQTRVPYLLLSGSSFSSVASK
jgi:hypothetical protein